jgi:hypothetical protein
MHNFDVRWGDGGGLYRSWRQLGGGCGSGGPRPLGVAFSSFPSPVLAFLLMRRLGEEQTRLNPLDWISS